MNTWMDEWMNGKANDAMGESNGWVEWKGERRNGRMESMDGMERRTDEWTDEWMDGMDG